jgi:hypothetical protein
VLSIFYFTFKLWNYYIKLDDLKDKGIQIVYLYDSLIFSLTVLVF